MKVEGSNLNLDTGTIVVIRRMLANSLVKLNPIDAHNAFAGVQYSVNILSNLLGSEYDPEHVQKNNNTEGNNNEMPKS